MKSFVRRNYTGFTLVEALIATLLASIMSISVISIYVNQSASISSESQREASTLEANRAYDIVTRLLRQAQRNAVIIDYTGAALNGNTLEIPNDDISITFELPDGFNIWPNNTPPFDQNIVQISWDNSSTNQHVVTVRNGTAVATLGIPRIIAGANTGDDVRIVNLDVWPMQDQFNPAAQVTDPASNGYFMSLTTRAAVPDFNYTNPDDPTGPLKNFRTHTVSGIISPRN